jgi:hypothetical protein
VKRGQRMNTGEGMRNGRWEMENEEQPRMARMLLIFSTGEYHGVRGPTFAKGCCKQQRRLVSLGLARRMRRRDLGQAFTTKAPRASLIPSSGRYQYLSDSLNGAFWLVCEIVFPDSHYRPPSLTQRSIHNPVAGDVGLHLGGPEGAAGPERGGRTGAVLTRRRREHGGWNLVESLRGRFNTGSALGGRGVGHGTLFEPFGRVGMNGTTVPETAVDE